MITVTQTILKLVTLRTAVHVVLLIVFVKVGTVAAILLLLLHHSSVVVVVVVVQQ